MERRGEGFWGFRSYDELDNSYVKTTHVLLFLLCSQCTGTGYPEIRLYLHSNLHAIRLCIDTHIPPKSPTPLPSILTKSLDLEGGSWELDRTLSLDIAERRKLETGKEVCGARRCLRGSRSSVQWPNPDAQQCV
jgi:hypothetical protein